MTDRTWNIDETSAALLPVGVAGWKRKGSSGSWEVVGDMRAGAVHAATRPVPSPLLSQEKFAAKTSASLPSGPLPPNITTIFTESHGRSQESLVEVIEMIDKVMSPPESVALGAGRGLDARGLSLSRCLDSVLSVGGQSLRSSRHDSRGPAAVQSRVQVLEDDSSEQPGSAFLEAREGRPHGSRGVRHFFGFPHAGSLSCRHA